MPGPAPMLAAALERVGVEVVGSLARQAGQGAVIERQLHHVGVAAVEIEVQHALRPEDQGDRGAGLGVSRLVRQIVGLGEALVRRLGPEPARHVHLGRRDVAPQRLAGALQALVVQLEGEVGHPRGHVHAAHRVPDHLGLLAHGDVRLVVLIGLGPVIGRIVAARQRFLSEIMRLAPPLVDEIGREFEPPLVAGQAIELDQRELDLLMPGIAALLARSGPEGRGDMIQIALHHVDEPALAGRAKIGDRAFEQVAGVVELVTVAQVRPAVLGLALVVPAVQIAVGRLRPCEVVDDGVDLRLDVGIAPVAERGSSRPRSICRRPSPRTPAW